MAIGFNPYDRNRSGRNPHRDYVYEKEPLGPELGGAVGGGCLMYVFLLPLFLIVMLIGLVAFFGWCAYGIAWLGIKGFYEVQTESDEVPRWFGVWPHPMWNAYTTSSGRTALFVPSTFSSWGVLLMCFAIGLCIAGIVELIASALSVR